MAEAAHPRTWAPALFWCSVTVAWLVGLEWFYPGIVILSVLILIALSSLPGLLAVRRERLKVTGLGDSFGGRLANDAATTLGAGYAPKAPGTFGALAGLPLAGLLARLPLLLHVVLLVGFVLLSFAVAARYMRGRHSRLDPQEVVLDETLGCAIACAFVPFQPAWALLAFAAFRLFDIWKPGPVGWVDRRIKTPAGIMLDDVVAGLLAGAVLILVRSVVG